MKGLREQAFEQVKEAGAKLCFEHYSGQHPKLVFGCPECTKMAHAPSEEVQVPQRHKAACCDAVNAIEAAVDTMLEKQGELFFKAEIKQIRDQIDALDKLLFS